MLDVSSLAFRLMSALTIGLLIGAERERRKGEGPSRSAAGIRTYAIVSLMGAVSVVIGSDWLLAVAVRAGRGDAPGEVIVQTWFPEHYAVQFAAQHDYRGYYEKEARYRSWMKYPPFSALANVLVRSESLDSAMKWSGMLGRWLEQQPKEGIRALGPAPAPLSKLKNDYRYHFVLKSQSRAKLNAIVRAMLGFAAQQKIPRGNVVADVDAVSLL